MEEGEVVVGRSDYCSLVIDGASVSRLHATFRRVGLGLELCDLESKHGTFVNGEQIHSPRLLQVLNMRLPFFALLLLILLLQYFYYYYC